MKSKNKLIYTALFLLFIPLSYSITLEELLSSYDFSYSDNSIKILNITHYGANKTGGLFNLLIINLTLNLSENGNYTFTADLFRNEEYISSSSKGIYLKKGRNNTYLEFNPRLLFNGIYNLSLSIDRNEQNVYNNYSAYSFNFGNADYEKPEFDIASISHEFIDNDSDSKFNILRLNLQIDSKVEKNAEISVYLTDNNAVLIKKANFSLINGLNSLSLYINANETKHNKMESLLLYKISVNDYSFDENYLINDYGLPELESDEPQILGVINENAIDIEQNGLIDYLQLGVSVDIKEEGIYTLQTSLYSIYDEFIGNIKLDSYLNLGKNTIPLIINGTRIYSKKINGPYTLVYLKLLKQGYDLDYVSNPYTTQYYTFDQFEKPPLPDLEVEIEAGNETINVLTSNKGKTPAFNFFIEVYDNMTLIKSEFVFMLSPNESNNITLENENQSILLGIADFNNYAEESDEENNFYFYQESVDEDGDGFDSDDDCNDSNAEVNPAEIEVCDGLDNDCDLSIDEEFDKDSDGVADCFDNCLLVSNANQEDADNDKIGDLCDSCPDTIAEEEVDKNGCSNTQFCSRQGDCGPSCDSADWKGNEPNEKYPNDCKTVILQGEGKLKPICAGSSCAG